MKIVDIANEIYSENGSPNDTSIPSIAFWIRSNIGKLNALLYEQFSIDEPTLEISDSDGVEIDVLAASILKMMYKVYRVDLDIRAIMSGLSLDTVLEAGDQEFRVKRVNRSEVLKTLTQLKKDTLKEMNDLVHNYRSYNAAPQQIAGDDDQKGYYYGEIDAYTRNPTMNGGNH